MDFTVHDELAEHRAAAARWVERHLRPEWVAMEHESGTHHNHELHALLADQGLLGAGWPAEYGGTGVDVGFADAVFDAIEGFGLRMDGWVSTWMILNTILEVGTEQQKSAIIPAGLRGEALIVLGYTEPGAGSDMAAARTRATLDGDSWVIDGAKMFTSTAHEASHVFLLARTNQEAAKHRGLSTFLVPLDSAGVEIQPIHTLGGQRTNATYYTGVRVPDSARVGDVDGGWRVMRVAMVFERSKTGRAGLTMVAKAPGWLREQTDPAGRPLFDDPSVQEQLARMAMDEEVSRLLDLRVSWLARSGALSGVEAAMAKLYASVTLQRQHEDLLDLMGPEATLGAQAPGAPIDGAVEFAFRNSVVETIYGGASEILREIIAENRLGLPRSRPIG